MITYTAEQAENAGILCWDNMQHEEITELSTRVVIVREWSRDCDMCEATRLSAYPATDAHLRAAHARMERNAEGPWSLEVITLEEAEDTRTGIRDLAMEAFENGHGANAYLVGGDA